MTERLRSPARGVGRRVADGASFGGVYVHVPFCGRRCSYCDFAIAVRRDVPVREFVDAVLAEIEIRRVQPIGGALRTLYLGGGTPSKLGADGLTALIRGIAHRLGVDELSTSPDRLEVTIEVNPEDVTAEAAAAWAGAGVNRASVGVQSFDPKVLTWMHREHGPDQAELAFRTLRAAGIQELSLDLIFAVPEALARDWDADLERAIALEPDHLSLYGLTVEPQTPLGKWTARGEVTEAPEEWYEGEFLRADARLAAAGFEHYEVSNYARPGKRARHNSSYWKGIPYLGLGPSAHGFDGIERRWNRPAYASWLEAVQGGADPMEGREVIGPSERVAESVYLGLRTTDGLEVGRGELATVRPWVDAGWAELRPAGSEGRADASRLVLTPSGWLRLDSIAAALTSLRSRS
ncbi:MAG: radical SAM family heme chaperone HemW [Gemmatimonadaceae bacterium]